MKPARAFCLAVLGATSCATAPPAGRSAAGLERAEAVPAGYVALGSAHARCASAPAWGHLDAEPLTRFACREEALLRALEEQAVARGGTVLAGRRCRRGSHALACSATIAAPADGSRPLGQPVSGVGSSKPRDAITFETARAIEVDLEPATPSFGRRARSSDEVGVQSAVPVSHLAVGSLAVRCEKSECDFDALRVALRMAAGGLGVSDIAEVACGVRRDDAFCVATLAAAELDPETDPRAR